MRKLILSAAAALVLAIAGTGLYLSMQSAGEYRSPAMLNAGGADIGGPFELTAHTGERATAETVIDRPALFYFGYTFCPDICPVDSQVMADAVEILSGKGIDVRPVFVTVDPARDTPKELGYFVESLHPKMVGLTGTEDEIRAMADSYKVYFNRVDMPDSAAEYLMEHTGYMYLMTPDKGLTAVFRNGFPPEQLAKDIEAILGAL